MLHYAAVRREKNNIGEKGRAWKVKATCPGYVATRMDGRQGVGQVEEGAVNAVRLAILDADDESGDATTELINTCFKSKQLNLLASPFFCLRRLSWHLASIEESEEDCHSSNTPEQHHESLIPIKPESLPPRCAIIQSREVMTRHILPQELA